MIKITLKMLSKVAVSGIIALMILTLFGYFYYNTPPSRANEDGSTNYKWEGNRFYFQGSEGFGWGRINNDGFTNMFDYNDNMKVDILIMGSSHMEARQVSMRQSTASQLNALLENEIVYNIGMSGHSFLNCVRNFGAALNRYRPTKFVVLETHDILFADEETAFAASAETVDPEPFNHDRGIRGLLRRNPYLRLINSQIVSYKNLQAGDTEAENSDAFSDANTANNENLLTALLQTISALAEESGVKVIIAYHPSTNIAADGAINLGSDSNTITQFRRLCDDNGILFLDMSSRFKEEYERAYIVPYGFSNSPVGEGHLNKYGHAMMADELYALISEVEQ